nr:hypothetical protein [Tanacetum cinerariifolium]
MAYDAVTKLYEHKSLRVLVLGKENEVNILKSIDKGPLQMRMFKETLVKCEEGAFHLGLERPRVYSDLSPEEKDRYNVESRATNILLQGSLKDIYTLINHYTDAKDIWDNVKMLLEALKLNRGFRDFNYDLMYVYLMQHKAHANENKVILDRFSQHTIDRLTLRVDRIEVMETMHRVQLVMEELITESGILIQFKQGILSATTTTDLALNVNNVFQADHCNAFDSNVDEAPTAQTMLMANLSSAYPVYGKAGPSYDSDILSEYVKDNNVPVVQSSLSSIQNDRYMMILNDIHEQPAQHVSVTTQNNVVDNLLSAKCATSKEQVELLIISLHRNLINPLHSGSINPFHGGLVNTPHSGLVSNKMADENVPTPAPIRTDDQILPFVAWVFNGKNNFVLDLHKGKKNLIFHIFLDILHNTNFFKAFTASALPKSKERRRRECKQPKPKPVIEKSSKPAPAPKSKATKERPSKASTTKLPKLKPAKEKSTKTTPPQKAGKGRITKVREGDKNDMELAIQMSLESFQA